MNVDIGMGVINSFWVDPIIKCLEKFGECNRPYPRMSGFLGLK